MRKKLALLLAFLLLLTLSSALATPQYHSQFITNKIVELNDYAGDALITPHPAIVPFSATYIGNSHSGIFHYSYCRYVGRMSESHKVFFESRDDAINAGYRPCKVCKP
ncbi:Hypothetical protein LUCI_0837 [Lucifera butyrica]|uniref:Ada DNA repair metal-binding domain-containing protein n=1 Tax=Lucifera butyrica TaxID=1351585 RepID=A0A498R466_9FIRM|nr:Ada metal-binding domain-containing protein [Lucifera butyrica]VBB05627.1 Hypothetical protein LUCI_0837 [Lucifera butyrica]